MNLMNNFKKLLITSGWHFCSMRGEKNASLKFIEILLIYFKRISLLKVAVTLLTTNDFILKGSNYGANIP